MALSLLDMCKQTGLRIMNGRCGEDKSGQYTHMGSRGSSVVDYVVSSQHFFKHVSNFRIESTNRIIVLLFFLLNSMTNW